MYVLPYTVYKASVHYRLESLFVAIVMLYYGELHIDMCAKSELLYNVVSVRPSSVALPYF